MQSLNPTGLPFESSRSWAMKRTISSGVEKAAGTVTFTDADTTDVHTVSVTPMVGGYVGTLTPVIATDSTGGTTGSVSWTYSVSDSTIAGLAAGQSLTQTYTITIKASNGVGSVATLKFQLILRK